MDIRVAIVEDQERIRKALEAVVEGTPELLCVGAFGDAESLLAAKLAPDVVLMDIGLPGMSGTEAIGPFKARWPKADVLMLTVYQDEDRIFQALCAGAVGYLLKTTPPGEIVEAIREIHAGGAPMTPSIARQVVRLMHRTAAEEEALSDREHEVLQKLTEGKTNRQIAGELFVSANTVAFHIKQIYAKLHVHSRAEAVARVLRSRR